jgi:hypothetical protein
LGALAVQKPTMRKVLFGSALGLVVVVVACGGSTTSSQSSSGSSGGTSGTSGNGSSSGASGGTSGTTSGGTSGASGTSGTSGNPPPAGSYTVTFPTTTVAAGVEKTQCVTKRLGNPTSMHMGQIHNVLGPASHHMIVYRVADTVEQLTPVDCKPFTDALNPAKGSPLIVTQKKDDLLQLPQGVAYTLQADQMVRLEVHYINAGANPVDLTATSTFSPIADGAFQNEADFLFIGNPDISINPNQTFTLGPSFFTMPADLAGANFFAITGHEHQFGTNVKISSVANATDTGTAVYDVPNWSWSEPKTQTFDPPFQVPAGGGFKFTCDWNNTSANKVTFGESANNEMCFFWAYYYPSKGARVCFHTAQAPAPSTGFDLCCPNANPQLAQACGALGAK